MPTPIAKMGRAAGKHMTNFHGDLIRDGMTIQRYENEGPFLWLLRETGTDLFLLNVSDGMLAEASNSVVERADKCFLIQYADSSENGVFISIPKSEAKNLLEMLHPMHFGVLQMYRKIQGLVDLYG